MDRTSCGWTASVVPAVRRGQFWSEGTAVSPASRAARHRPPPSAPCGRWSRRHDEVGESRSGLCPGIRPVPRSPRQCTARSPLQVATTGRHYRSPPQVATTRGTIGSASVLGRVHSTGQLLRSGSADRPKSGFREPRPAALCWSRSDYLVGGSSQLFDGSSVIFSAHSQHSAALANSFSARKTLPKCCHRVASGLSADHVRRDHRRRRRRVGGAAGPTVSP